MKTSFFQRVASKTLSYTILSDTKKREIISKVFYVVILIPPFCGGRRIYESDLKEKSRFFCRRHSFGSRYAPQNDMIRIFETASNKSFKKIVVAVLLTTPVQKILKRPLTHFSNKSPDGTIRNFSLLILMGRTSIALSCARISAGTFGLLYWIGDGALDTSSSFSGPASLATIER